MIKSSNQPRRTKRRLERQSQTETSGPAENLREEAAEMTDKSQDSKEPA